MTTIWATLAAPFLVIPLLASTLFMALLIDRYVGDPVSRLHPVCMIGSLASFVERYLRHGANNITMFLAGMLACVLVVVAACGLAYFLVSLPERVGESHVAWGMSAVIIAFCLAPQSLDEHARRVAKALMESTTAKSNTAESSLAGPNLTDARKAVSMMVGRQPDTLDEHGVARACVESVAENLVDGVLATLFWAGVGLCLFGYAGGAVCAVLHRSVNVLDAMWGKKNETYKRFGTFSARLDDVLNFVPARLSLPCIALAAYTFSDMNGHHANDIGWQYRNAHESPNSAWSEAAFAGALGLKLGGPAMYGDTLIDHPWLGEGNADVLPSHILQAIRLMWRTTLLFASIITADIMLFRLTIGIIF